MSSTHHRPGTVLELSSLLRSVFLSPVFSSVSVYLGPKHLLSKPHSPPLRPSCLPALTPTYPLLGLIPPKMPTPPPQSCLSAPSPASEEHAWTRVPSEVREEEKGVLGPAGWARSGISNFRWGWHLCRDQPSHGWDYGWDLASIGLEPD